MKKLTQVELNEILRLHGLWLKNNKEGVRANLSNYNLRSVNLQSANLQGANLYSANLQSADLQGADLQCACLQSAYLQGANLYSANLLSANLRGANLRDANLYLAIINNTKFEGTIYADKTLLTANFGKHTAFYFGNDLIQIGCEKHSIEYWLTNYEEIGKKAEYTTDQIRLYGKFIKQVYKTHFKVGKS